MALDESRRARISPVYDLLSPHDALVAWRSNQELVGRAGIEAFKDIYVAQIARSDLSSPEAIKHRLPGSLAPFAGEIAAVCAQSSKARQLRAAMLARRVARVAGPSSAGPAGLIGPPPPVQTTNAASPSSSASVVPPTAPPATAGTPVVVAAHPAPADVAGVPGERIDPGAFAPMSFTEPTGEPGPLRAVAGPNGISLSWKSFDTGQPVVVYRVVSRDDGPPWSPDEAELVAATTETGCVDRRPAEGAVRHLQVWANAGESLGEAIVSQPRLVAATAVVNQVIGLDLREEEGTVIGQWGVWDGVTAVQVLRIPLAKAAQLGGNTEYRILQSQPNLGGFVDRTADRGRKFLYQVYAEAVVDDVIALSAPINTPISVSAALDGVADLQVALHGSGNERTFDVGWTAPPAGKVVVFRSESGPVPGAELHILAESALEQTGLKEVDKLAHPVNPISGGRVGMSDVPWPRSWNRAFFTPVTVLEGRALVGRTVAATRTETISDPKIIERVDRQIVTFSWPAGASSVLMFTGPTGGQAESAMTGPSVEIGRQEWEKLGGLQLRNSLPSRGCSLHLLPIAFDGGRRIEGAPCSIDYPYLVRIYYRVEVKRNLLRKPTAAFISIASADPIVMPTSFVVVHHPTRLPLDITDGTPLPVSVDGEPGAQLSNRITVPELSPDSNGNRWRADLSRLTGFIRLFIDIETPLLAQWALLDPAVGDLTLGAALDGR